MLRFVTILMTAGPLLACGGGAETTSPGAATSVPAPRPEAEGTAEAPPEATPEAQAEPEPEATPSIRLRGEAEGSVINIVIEARGEAPSAIGPRLRLEREVDGTWQEVSAHLTVRDSCDVAEAAPCTTLTPGAEYRPPPWLGLLGDAQCECTRCGPAEAGTYRFVAESCRGTQRVDGESFRFTRR